MSDLGTIRAGQVNTSDGIFLGAPGNSYAALYFVLPTTQTTDNALTPPRFTYSSAPGNFRLITYLNSSKTSYQHMCWWRRSSRTRVSGS